MKSKQIKALCLDRLSGRARCKSTCAVVFPDTPEMREKMRPVLKAIMDSCPYRDRLKRRPIFGDPEEILKRNAREGSNPVRNLQGKGTGHDKPDKDPDPVH